MAYNRAGRKLLIGVLPHPFCNPAVTGCGYCTFPHEPGNSARASEVAASVMKEMEYRVTGQLGDLFQRPVEAVYFGGGTANLIEPEPFQKLCVELTSFDLSGAEVTLEGVPAYFLRGRSRLLGHILGGARLLDVMKETLPARRHRLSMGIQTFDEARLKQMGRAAFGNAETFREVVELGQRLGYATSADLLFDLPGQTLAEMRSDVRRAMEIGLHHIGLYHLVLFRGLGTPWAEDEGLLAELPDNERACEHWLALREELLGQGFVQTTLTNFERGRFAGQPDRYQYEEMSFRPDEYEMLGFGPSATSYASSKDFGYAIKAMNPTSSREYTEAVQKGNRVWNRMFLYRPHDQKALWLIRRLSALSIERGRYRQHFGLDPVADFPDEFSAMQEAGLIQVEDDRVRPTPRGMFYSDAMATLLANRAVRSNRDLGPARLAAGPDSLVHDRLVNTSAHFAMG